MFALCLYDRRVFPAPAVRAVGAVHTGTAPVERGALLRFAFTPSGVNLSGEVDESNLGALRAVLAELPAARRTVIDATAVAFLSAAAAAELLRAAARARDLRVTCAPPVARALSAAGAPATPGLTVEGVGT